MEIRKPKFELGQKVVDKNGNVETVTGFDSYHFDEDEYWYNVSSDGGTQGLYTETYLDQYAEKPKTVWDLQKGDECYFATVVGHIFSGTWDNWDAQIENRKLGNVFLTRKEAEYELERIKIETEMLRLGGRREFKNGKNNYYIVCDFDTHYSIVVFNNKTDGFAPMTIYFDSAKECRNAIETIGEYRIKRYIFKLGISCNEN